MLLRVDSISLWLRIRWSCLLFLLAASIQSTGATALAQPVEARVASVQGAALRRNNQRAFLLARGDLLNPGDEIDTRGGGRVVIELTDGSVVVVGQNSRVVISDYRAAPSLREMFRILVGRVRVKIAHYGGKPNPYRVNSPTASILVRGTEFDVAVEPSGDTTVVVYEGLVEVQSLSDPRQRALLSKGGGAQVKANEEIHLFTPGSGNKLDEKGAKNDDADNANANINNEEIHLFTPGSGNKLEEKDAKNDDTNTNPDIDAKAGLNTNLDIDAKAGLNTNPDIDAKTRLNKNISATVNPSTKVSPGANATTSAKAISSADTKADATTSAKTNATTGAKASPGANASSGANATISAKADATISANVSSGANTKANANAKRDGVGGGVEAPVKSTAGQPDGAMGKENDVSGGAAVKSAANLPVDGSLQINDVTANAATSVRTYLANDYERYIDSMAGLNWSLPLRRFGALADSHFDSLDNPAYSTEITSIEGRVWLIPSFNKALGGNLRSGSADFPLSGNLISPLDSGLLAVGDFFIPLERVRMVIGGAVAVSTDRSQSLTVNPAPASLIRIFPNSGRISRQVAVSNETIAITGSLMAARRFGDDGRTSVGVGMELVSVGADLRGQTSLVNGARTLASEDLKTESQINRLRFRLGMTREFDGGHKLGLVYTQELANADDRDRSRLFNGLPLGLDSTRQEGRSSEVSFRLRGPFTRRLFYGLEGSLLRGESDGQIRRAVIADSTTRADVSSAVVSFGLGFALRRTTVLSGDFAFGLSRVREERFEDATGDPVEDRRERERYISAHVGLQTDVWRQLFASASALVIGEANTTDLNLFPDLLGRRLTSLGLAEPSGRSLQNSTNLFSDFGAGWRLRPNLVAEYIFSINNGLGPPRHIFLLRYTFRREK
jgi:FecR protein